MTISNLLFSFVFIILTFPTSSMAMQFSQRYYCEVAIPGTYYEAEVVENGMSMSWNENDQFIFSGEIEPSLDTEKNGDNGPLFHLEIPEEHNYFVSLHLSDKTSIPKDRFLEELRLVIQYGTKKGKSNFSTYGYYKGESGIYDSINNKSVSCYPKGHSHFEEQLRKKSRFRSSITKDDLCTEIYQEGFKKSWLKGKTLKHLKITRIWEGIENYSCPTDTWVDEKTLEE